MFGLIARLRWYARLRKMPRTRETWRAGDVAECVSSGPWSSWAGSISQGPQRGSRAMVSSVEVDSDHVFLTLIGYPSNHGYHALCFRKIVLRETGADRKVRAPAPNREMEGVDG